MQDVHRYGNPVVSQLVYERTKEQRDFWKEYAENLKKLNGRLAARVAKLERAIQTASSSLKDPAIREEE